MESMTPGDARDALAQVDAARLRMAEGLRLPSSFHLSLGLAVAVQVGTAAWAVTAGGQSPPALSLLSAGYVAFLVVGLVQLRRFRRLNGASVNGLMRNVVLGSSLLASAVYGGGLALALWAGFADRVPLIGVAAALTGAGYAVAGRRWWSRYRAEPERHVAAGSTLDYLVLVPLAVLGLVLLLVGSR